MADRGERNHRRIDQEEWDEDNIHRLQISDRMLQELNDEGETTSAGTSIFGPELLIIELIEHGEIND